MKSLLVIDVQAEYMERYEENLLEKINQRIKQAIESNELVIYIKNVRKLRNGMTTYEFASGLNLCSSYVIYKEKSSAFSANELIDILNKNTISKIEIIGVDGNYCVSSSAIDARKLGYEVILQCKYIGVQNLERFEKKKEMLIKQGINIIL